MFIQLKRCIHRAGLITGHLRPLIFIIALMSPCVQAATDLAPAPVNFLVSALVKPNIYFILDDSGSMVWSYVGDEVVARGYEKTVGYRSHRCNKIYYNPAVIYPVPVHADGSLYASQSFTSARYDGFNSGSVTVDLSSEFTAWRNSTSKPAVPADTTDVKYRADCTSNAGNCTAGSGTDHSNSAEAAYYYVFTGDDATHLGDGSSSDPCLDQGPNRRWRKVIVSASSGPGDTDEQGNFANWFSYHRTRMLTMKTALGRAFRDIDDQFRVGFSTIGEPGVTDSPGFLKITDFTTSHKNSFYDKLYAVNPAASTPLRAALSKAGRLYAGKLLADDDDPVRYSCQKNFTVLSTDGYWNTSWESGSYGPKKIDGVTNVGDQDGHLPAPMGDGNLDNRRIYVATITLAPDTTSASSDVEIHSIRVGTVELLSSPVGVYGIEDSQARAPRLAWSAEARQRATAYRLIAQGPVMYVVAIDTPPATPPEVTVAQAITATVEGFREADARLRRSDTLADVAAYYFQTDLRTTSLANCGTNNVCDNNVPVRDGVPGGSHQHMVTHTVGLGASGSLRYQENYAEADTGDFRDIAEGRRGWPDPILFNGPERVDDLWHAAVNGGGRYFNASSPEQLARALSETMANIRSAVGAGAAVATSNQEPAEGDNLLFGTHYRSVYWDGELEARRISLADGSISPDREWAAAAKLDARVGATTDKRTVWLQSGSLGTELKPFLWNELSATEQGLLAPMCGDSPKLSQCISLNASEKSALTGQSLLNYLRGQQGFEDRPANSLRLFRRRQHVLGAPANAPPLYVGRPAFRYADDHYGEYRDSTEASREGVVYVAANDGMLHAFDAAKGNEKWAFIPAAVLPGMFRNADVKFAQRFSYLLDGAPVAGDICPAAATSTAAATTPTNTTSTDATSTDATSAEATATRPRCTAEQWRTILVGGLGAAGREFYALDITDPDHPRSLWRFGVAQDDDLGYALGRPLITKRQDGRWVVVLTSGYNNINPGSGQGYLFVLDAYTGTVLQKIGTGAGSTTQPSGLGQVNGWVESVLDNTSLRFYGGDLLGNVWRFDIDGRYPPEGREAFLLAKLVRDGKPQPVTTRPEISEVRLGLQRSTVVTVGTGSYLGLTDASDKEVQSVYSFRDDLSATGLGDVRTKLIAQTLSSVSGDTSVRKVSANTVDWSEASAKPGWYLDLSIDGALTGERVTLDPDQQQGILRVVTNVPDGTACRIGAESWIYEIDYLTGSHVPLAKEGVIATRIASGALASGARSLKLGEKTITLVTDERGGLSSMPSLSTPPSVNPVRRVSWRELDE